VIKITTLVPVFVGVLANQYLCPNRRTRKKWRGRGRRKLLFVKNRAVRMLPRLATHAIEHGCMTKRNFGQQAKFSSILAAELRPKQDGVF
jgi:hypothetical protein